MKKKSILHLFCLLFSCLAIFGGIFLLTDTAIVDNNTEVSDEVEAADPIHRKAYKGEVYYSPTGDGDFKYTTYLSGEKVLQAEVFLLYLEVLEQQTGFGK